VALPALTIEALRQHKKGQSAQRLLLGGAYADHGLVCTSTDGKPWPPNAFSAAFLALASKAGLTLRFHDLRHTHATQLLRQGVHPKVVSERLGHATVGITLDVYSHVLIGD
jgi:integrase